MFSRTMRQACETFRAFAIFVMSNAASCSCALHGRAAPVASRKKPRRLRALVTLSSSVSSHPPQAVVFDLGKVCCEPCRRRSTPPAMSLGGAVVPSILPVCRRSCHLTKAAPGLYLLCGSGIVGL